MNTSTKYKVCRRLGSGVFEKCQTPKFVASEERYYKNKKRGKRRKNVSDYGQQLLEKQKMRFTYGVSERQFSNYVKKARTRQGVLPANYLYQQLESRLDNIVYRLGIAATRPFARQLVAHGHIDLNGTRTGIPSAMVRVGDTVSIRERSKGKPVFSELADTLKKHKPSVWLSMDEKKLSGEVKDKPDLEKEDVAFNVTSVMEYYSR